jgi:hypothetical protein
MGSVLEAPRLSAPPPDADGKVFDFLTAAGAAETRHGAGSLLRHLIGVAAILEAWGQPDDVRLAGALHSIYGTEAFRTRLVGLDRRAEVARRFGERVERLVHLFCTLPRRSLLEGRWRRGGTELSPADLGAVAILHMANLLDLADAASPPGGLRATIAWGAVLDPARDRVPGFLGLCPPLDKTAEAQLYAEYNRALAALAAGEPEPAAAALAAVCALCPGLAEPHVWFAVIDLQNGDFDAAARRGAKARELLPLWGAPWDKRQTLAQWIEIAGCLERKAGAKMRLAAPWPARDGLDGFRRRLGEPALCLGNEGGQGEGGGATDGLPPRFSAYVARTLSERGSGLPRGYPGLDSKPWWDPGDFPVVGALEAAFPAIRSEVLQVSGFQPESEAIGRTGSWDVAFLYELGRRREDVCAQCPTLAAIVDENPSVRRIGLAYISRLRPGTMIRPHRASSPTRLRCHLPILAPSSGCGISVGGEARTWREGRCLILDDSFTHHAWNRSNQDRIVVVMDLWNPALSVEEVRLLIRLHGYAQSHAARVTRYHAANAKARLQADDDSGV